MVDKTTQLMMPKLQIISIFLSLESITHSLSNTAKIVKIKIEILNVHSCIQGINTKHKKSLCTATFLSMLSDSMLYQPFPVTKRFIVLFYIEFKKNNALHVVH